MKGKWIWKIEVGETEVKLDKREVLLEDEQKIKELGGNRVSNLGCVWYIDTKRGIREKYPVVYDNAQYWVCKIPGSFNVKEIRKDYCVDSQYWETVKESMSKGVQFCGEVYVKCGEKLDNKKVSRQGKRELEKSKQENSRVERNK